MKITIRMRDQRMVELLKCTYKDFLTITDAMKGWNEAIIWKETVWIRKKDIISIILENDDETKS